MVKPFNRRWFAGSILAGYLALGVLGPLQGAGDDPELLPGRTLLEALEDVSAKYGILIKGLEKTSAIPARSVHGSLREQLRQLLFDFNYVLVQSADGSVEKIFVLNQKKAAPAIPQYPEHIVLNTLRKGGHHVVQAIVQGPSGASMEVSLLVDTGASLVVLPASMLSELGFSPGELKSQEIATANGRLQAKIGRLDSFQIGSERMDAVNAAFIEDSLLGSNGLLGMNVLGRYLVTIDDQQNLITLIRQR
ncbi:retropepsin-like aspartic protease family protein [Nitrosococcus watsonii]|uniref:Peptidase A2 domain-containing protein n=1 Tax=Nitrosococcus watsoni (strain C-113) TaxID=105559 RepID=D8K735_NITWC|nr:retropepsin-like aspartic protease [Nitrosococcus watsonii]ADJ28712.1 conserved hypothetical protein [Nitrosococcus watsonii C-113]